MSIIKFALAAPVLVQEKRRACVDVVYIPEDMITVLGKRGDEDELEKIWEEYFDNLGHEEESGNLESPATDTSSSSATSEDSDHDHGSTNVVQAPVPNPESSTANPDLMSDFVSTNKGDYESHWPHYTPTSSGYGSDLEFMEANVLQPNRPMPWTDLDSSTDPDLDWNYWTSLEDSPSPRPASQEGFGQAHKYQVDLLSPPSTSGYAPSPPEYEPEVVTPSPPSSNLGSLSLSADSQPVDAQAAAIYAAKGKAKVSRHISGPAIDVENAVQRELQPGKRSLDQGE